MEDLFAKENNTLKEIMRIIDIGGLGIAIIVDENKILKGTVTDGDVRKALSKGIDINASACEIMNKNPIKIKEGFGKKEILKQLNDREKGFSRFYSLKIPVIDEQEKVKNIAVRSEEHTSELQSH